jgi:hypothetical protein
MGETDQRNALVVLVTGGSHSPDEISTQGEAPSSDDFRQREMVGIEGFLFRFDIFFYQAA